MTPSPHRVAFITDDWAHDKSDNTWTPNGSSFYRAYLPMTLIPGGVMGRPRFAPGQGFGVNDGTAYGKHGYDTVLLKLLMEKWVPKQMEIAKQRGQRLIVDVDDYYDGLHEANAAHAATDPAVNPVRNRDIYRRVIELADVVTVTTPFLQDTYSPIHPDVRVIRNGIHPNMFVQRPVTNRKPVIGWMGATSWRSGDLETMSGWLPDLLERHDLMFHHSGHHPEAPIAADLIGIPHHRASIYKMLPLRKLAHLMCFDIGLVPLNDVPFNHAKSNLKGLEYAASGIPFVAQALPEYRYLEDSGVGVTAASDDEWVEQVTRLLDPKERRKDARRNHDALMDQWLYTAFADQWIAALSPSTPAQTPQGTPGLTDPTP